MNIKTISRQFTYDGKAIQFEEGDSVLVAFQRAGIHPTGGGCLCLAGDCPHCIATIDGISYVRTCQVLARTGMVIENHPPDGAPLMSMDDWQEPGVIARNIYCDVVVIGMGKSGQKVASEFAHKDKQIVTLDAQAGQEVVGIYPGHLVVARTEDGMLHVHPREEIIVASGAAEIHPVVPGNHLAGILTARAALKLAAAGVEMNHLVAIGTQPEGLDAERIVGELIRFEGNERVEAVVVINENGIENRIKCDTVSIGLGLYPRDTLVRMGHDMAVRAVGGTAREADIPPCPKAGTVCHCANVTVEDLESVRDLGFHELELLKRGTLAGTGTCQGGICLPYIRSFLADKGEKLQAPFTARPVNRQLTIGEMAAGSYHHATPRTSLDAEHRQLGARMERFGGWWRPWNYGNISEEYWAVRQAVSLCDVSTLGKMLVSGPDALELLERLYPTKVSTIKPGRSRYALLLDERGYVLDDGMICRDEETRFTLTFTSGGATFCELWVRDWAEFWGLDVRLLNQTMSLGAINVTGPLSKKLLDRAGLDDPPNFLHHKTVMVAGVECRIFRLSFTGETSFELHHATADSVSLWRSLLKLGSDLGIKPHGIESLLTLRLEKGHIIVGQDTDFDSTPRRINHNWAVKLEKPECIGKQSILRTNKIPLNRQLVGFELDGSPPNEGAVIWKENEYAGYVTSSGFSHVINKSVMLGWLEFFNNELPKEVIIDGRPAYRVSTPFYDPEGARARI